MNRHDPAGWAKDLGISLEAVELYLASDVIDLHLDSFIWNRIFGYDLTKRHGGGVFGHRFYSQVDIPRIRDARITGAIWVITTNPAREMADRPRHFVENLEKLTEILSSVPDEIGLVRTAADYERVAATGKHAAFIGIQGGNALDAPGGLDVLDDRIVRITLVHLSKSSLGQTSSPLGGKQDTGLTDTGRAYVEALDAKKIFVDLAHISKKGFFDAVEVHDKSLPLIVTHTGVSGVHEHWRNLDDKQLKAIADTGGTIGVMYESSFLGPSRWKGRASMVADHIMHIVDTVGEDYASLGSDWDGAIMPPRDLTTPLELPRVVQHLLDRGLSPDAIQKVLAKNFLRALRDLRG